MCYTDDPIADFNEHDAEQEAWLNRLPVCEWCREHIQQEKAIYYDRKWFCKDCEDEAWEAIRLEFLEKVDAYG